MPLFAGLVLSLCNGFFAVFGQFLAMRTAVKLAAFSALVTIATAFLLTVAVCLSSLYSMSSALVNGAGAAGGWIAAFFMGVGMFIPSNAGAVMACIGSVWIATSVYKFQRDAVLNFGS
jgi:hypothetical protein